MTEAEKPARKPSTKKASAAAREAEAEDGFVVVEHLGLSLRIPVGGKVPYRARRAFLNGDDDLGNELLFGVEQWEALMDKNPTIDDMNEIGRKLGESAGN